MLFSPYLYVMRHLTTCFALLAVAHVYGQQSILDMRENYNIGQIVTVTGVVTSDDNLGSVRYLQDATAGIALYPGQDWSSWEATPQIGDSLSVTGEITEYNGLLEVGPNLTDVTFFGQGTVPTPLEITPAQMGEDLEGQLVRINGVTFPLAGTVITGNNIYDFTSAGESGVIYVRTSNSLVGEELTGCEVDMLGIVSQFSFDGLGGYQLLPRGPVDVVSSSPLCFTSSVLQSDLASTSFTLEWTTDLACDGTVEYGLTEDLGLTASAITGNTPSHFVNLEGLEPGTIYYARAVSTLEDGSSAVSTIRPYATVSESSGDIHVYFNGPVDHSVATEELALSLGTDMNDTLAAWILSAQHTLDVAAYNLNDQTVEDAINAAAANGVQIRWIYEGQNANIGLSSLDGSVVTHPRTDGEGSGMHNKFIIGDADHVESAFVLTGSTNFTTGNFESDLNNVIALEDQSLARAYELEFEEMWGAEGMIPDAANAKFGADKSWNTPVDFLVGGSPVELYFSPTDGTNAAIMKEIEAANADFEFALLTLTRDDLGDAIVELNQSFFVSPVGVIEQVYVTGSEFDNLLDTGVQVYAHEPSGDCHHKYAIVDHSEVGSDPLVITGSHNWSSSAENVNDENTLIVHDARVANLYHQEFRGLTNVINGIEEEVVGCTDSNACNFSPSAITDDGSCLELDECGICGGAGIAEGYCDCDGNVLDAIDVCGGSCLEDDDDNGVCDDQEVYGCSYPLAENFSSSVTRDDGSCIFPCEGVVNTNVFDWDGDYVVTVTDFLMMLSVYGDTDVDLDGVWDSGDDCVDTNACNYANDPSEPCTYIDILGVCGGGCEADEDNDGICDDVDTCIGIEDECGVCNGPGPTEVVIEDIVITYDSVFLPFDNDWYVFPISADTTFSYTCAPSFITCGDPVSYQGYDYATVLIGEQCWFAENLRSENYENGDEIPANLSDSEWENTSLGAVAVYGEGSGSCTNDSPDGDACNESWSLNEYGRLYNWYAVDDARGLCPSGWHVPTDGEWMTMEMALGMSEAVTNNTGLRGTDQGTQMKTTYGWHEGGNGTNSSGFSGLPGGWRAFNGDFVNAGDNGLWWCSPPAGFSEWFRLLYAAHENVLRWDILIPKSGLSVRCIRDAE